MRLGLLLLCFVASTALARPPKATAAYDQGVAHFKAERYREAIASFNVAYRVDPHPILLFNIARSFEELHDYGAAIDFYQRYLKVAPNARDRRQVKTSLATLERLRAQTTTLAVDSRPAGAEVLVDGEKVGETPLSAPVPSGVRQVALRHNGAIVSARRLDLQPGGAETLMYDLERTSDQRIWSYATLGLGGALLITSATFAVLTDNKDEELDRLQEDPGRRSAADFERIQDEGRQYAQLADGFLIAGLAAAAVGGVLYFTSDSAETVTGYVGPVSGLQVSF